MQGLNHMICKIHSATLVPDEELEEEGYHSLLCVAEIDGQVYRNFILVFDDLTVPYAIQKHCQSSVEPYEIELNDTEKEWD